MPALPPAIRWFYLLALGLIAMGLPWSRKFLSVALIALSVAWVAEGFFVAKGPPRLKHYFQPKYLWASCMFLPYVLGLLWSTDLEWGWRLVAIVLPLLLYPFFFAVLPPLREQERNVLLQLFVGSTLLVSIFSVAQASADTVDFRKYSPVISHIRLSLMVCFAIATCIWFVVSQRHAARFLLVLPVLWFLYYLSLLASIAGAIMLCALLFMALWMIGGKRKWLRLAARSIALLLVAGSIGFVSNAYTSYFKEVPITAEMFEERTKSGDFYMPPKAGLSSERGKKVWWYIAPDEFESAWNARSQIPLMGKDQNGQDIRYTAARYLTSLDLRKDAEGVAALTDEDVKRIEGGIAWHDMGKRNALRERVDMVFFEIDKYWLHGYVQGSSVAMRLVFWETAIALINENPWVGVGTGDTQMAFDAAYESAESALPETYRMRAHQQYLTWIVSWGILGFAFIVFAMLYPIRVNWRKRHPLFLSFLVIMLISFLSDDTLERQIGVSLFAFFYCLLLLAPISEQADLDRPQVSS